MEPEKTINPELVKKCAEMSGVRLQEIDGKLIVMRPEVYAFEHCDALEPWPKIVYDPMNSDTWQKALQMALERDGWEFGYNESFGYWAQNLKKGFSHVMAESPAMRLLKVISSLTGVPLYV